ncbi:hypothetical protein AB0Y20_00995 [Heyndrickxia oleronia]|uniref:hypothetical protein n=1 Tax=Heyndrickxia oleronia TaxID=38875 RepID=UPI003F2372B3
MRQPNIKLFGKTYKVIQIEFSRETGLIEKIIYQVSEHQLKTIFRSDEMITKSLTSTYKIKQLTEHPYHDYAYAPDLESLLIN